MAQTKIKQTNQISAAEVITLRLIVRAQARNQPVGITGE